VFANDSPVLLPYTGGATTMKLVTTADVAADTFVITVAASAPGLVTPRTVTMTLYVFGYNLSLDNSSALVFPDQNAGFQGTLAGANGYAATINLGCGMGTTNPPMNCSGGTFSPGQSFMVNASDSRIGDYAFNLVAVGGDPQALKRQMPVTLRVADFALSAPAPSSITLVNGSVGQIALTISSLGSFNSIVSLSCDALTLPAGVNCTFLPSSSMALNGGSAHVVLEISAANAAPAPASATVSIKAMATLAGISATKIQALPLQLNESSGTTDLAITALNHTNDPVAVGGAETFTANLVNQGATADNVTFVMALPDGTNVVSMPGFCALANGLITCALPSLAGGASTQISIKLTAPFTRSITVFGTLSSGTESDTNLSDNTASDTAQVRLRPFVRSGVPAR
jgi:hypothetical protein